MISLDKSLHKSRFWQVRPRGSPDNGRTTSEFRSCPFAQCWGLGFGLRVGMNCVGCIHHSAKVI